MKSLEVLKNPTEQELVAYSTSGHVHQLLAMGKSEPAMSNHCDDSTALPQRYVRHFSLRRNDLDNKQRHRTYQGLRGREKSGSTETNKKPVHEELFCRRAKHYENASSTKALVPSNWKMLDEYPCHARQADFQRAQSLRKYVELATSRESIQ